MTRQCLNLAPSHLHLPAGGGLARLARGRGARHGPAARGADPLLWAHGARRDCRPLLAQVRLLFAPPRKRNASPTGAFTPPPPPVRAVRQARRRRRAAPRARGSAVGCFTFSFLTPSALRFYPAFCSASCPVPRAARALHPAVAHPRASPRVALLLSTSTRARLMLLLRRRRRARASASTAAATTVAAARATPPCWQRPTHRPSSAWPA